MIADIQKLEAAARMAMGHFETLGNSPVTSHSRISGIGVLALAVVAAAGTMVAMSGTL
jgi:hypothetical protein